LLQSLSDLEKLGQEYGVPVIPVNHIEGHVLVRLISFTLLDF
jgi:tRNA A37 threonylcarbamoyltransferase TsaD